MGLPTDGGKVTIKYGNENTLDGQTQKEKIGTIQEDGTIYTMEEFLKDWGIHAGVDIKSTGSDDILAVYDGVVVWTKEADDNGGNVIMIQHEVDGVYYYSLYFHLKVDSKAGLLLPAVGTKVKKGDVIGQMGTSGTGQNNKHLHFEVRTSNGVSHNADGSISFPMDAGSWWANSSDELHTKWVDISCRFGGYDSFLPDAWK